MKKHSNYYLLVQELPVIRRNGKKVLTPVHYVSKNPETSTNVGFIACYKSKDMALKRSLELNKVIYY